MACRRLSATAGSRSRLASGSGSPWRARFSTNPTVLVLDEPSAALDPAAERLIVEGCRRVMRGRTTILISHRLELVRAADHVVVLDGARIVERGTPVELEARAGAFAALFATHGKDEPHDKTGAAAPPAGVGWPR